MQRVLLIAPASAGPGRPGRCARAAGARLLFDRVRYRGRFKRFAALSLLGGIPVAIAVSLIVG